MFNLDNFIAQCVTKRSQSMFLKDIENNRIQLYEKIRDKRVLVIGGGGSIGSSFIKEILQFQPASLVVVDTNENSLAELTRDIRSTVDMFVPEEYIPYPMDFSSSVFRKMFISRKGFDIVANFSAHKHVRSEKDIYSIEALIRNNILNLKGLLNLLSEYPPEEYFCVSTDKAANPVNIMGASKRIMEDLVFSYSGKFSVKTARFANVAFSNGSLPAGFLQRIIKMQPISAPSDIKRYFVSPEESGQICMLSCMLGKNRDIFFPKLKETQMMTFDSIATSLLNEYGYEVFECASAQEAVIKSDELKYGGIVYPVYYEVSDTSGEKLYEEFYTSTESIDMDRYTALGVITDIQVSNQNKLNNLLNNLEEAFDKEDTTKEEIVTIISSYLPGFKHIETGKTLDSKM